MSPAHARTFKPGETLAQFRNALIRVTRFDFAVTADHTGPRVVARDGCQGKRFVAALQSTLDVAAHNVGLIFRLAANSVCSSSGSMHRDDVNGDTKANATLSGTTSTLMPARSTIEGSVKNEGEPGTARTIDDKDSK